MKNLAVIAENILASNPKLDDKPSDNPDTFFTNFEGDQVNYYSFNDFREKTDLAEILETYLEEYGVTQKDAIKLASYAYELHQSCTDDPGDLPEFIYAMS